MKAVSRIKGGGYGVSTLSVVLLGVPAFKSASEDPAMLASLLAGMALSVGGMALRWMSHRMEMREEERSGRS